MVRLLKVGIYLLSLAPQQVKQIKVEELPSAQPASVDYRILFEVRIKDAEPFLPVGYAIAREQMPINTYVKERAEFAARIDQCQRR